MISVLAPELARMVEVAVFVPGAESDYETVFEGVRVIYRRRAVGPGALRYWSLDAARIAEAVRLFAPDIAHIQGMAGWGLWLDIPKIFTVHGIVDRDILTVQRTSGWGKLARHAVAHTLRWIEEAAARSAGHVIVINPYVLGAMPRLSGNALYHIPNPIDPIYISTPLPPHGGRERIVMVVGRVGTRKNTIRAVQLAARILSSDANARLEVCGAPETSSYLEHCRAAVKHVADQVEFTGNLSPSELISRMDRAACLLMTSEQETAPLAISEAHARGLPVVAPERFGITHMISPGEDGLFLTNATSEQDVAILTRALSHTWNRDKIRERAAIYSPAEVAKATIQAYSRVLSAASG